MFSQFRNAVESFAPQPARRGSQDAKSLPGYRPSSPALPRSSSSTDHEGRTHKMNLEERLRAKLAANSATPDGSSRASVSPTTSEARITEKVETESPDNATERVLSPTSAPLPKSPVLSPAQTLDTPAHPLVTPPVIHSPLPRSPIAPHIPLQLEEQAETTETRHPEADVPLPPQTPAENLARESTPLVDPEPVEEHTDESTVDSLQQRLKLVEQRFADVSTSYKRLQAEKLAADSILREFTPIGSVQDTDGLRVYLQNVTFKAEISQDEIRRLNGKLTRQDERMEELRDTHRMESSSQSEQIEQLRKQRTEAETLAKSAQSSKSQAEEELSRYKAEISTLQGEVERSKGLVKEEEEKRVKAISLLKTVRQKLVKAEKERDDAVKEVATMKEKERGEKDQENAERAKLQHEIETVNAEREKAIMGLKAQFDKELASLKNRYEKESATMEGQYELEAVTLKNLHSKEVAGKNSQISSLEHSVNSLSREKNEFFDQLQLRQAELESSQFHSESLQGQNTELQYQVRECNDRIALLNEELSEVRREQDTKVRGPSTSAEDVARLLSATEAKYESKVADLKRELSLLEKERNEGEADWSRKFREKAKEMDEFKRILESSARHQDQKEETLISLKNEIERLQGDIRKYQRQASELQARSERIKEVEDSTKLQIQDLHNKTTALEKQNEEHRTREAQLRASNKTLREELRKVQSSAALLERQRNPGVGYWTSRAGDAPSDSRTSISSSDSPSRAGSPRPSEDKNDEEVNLEYLRNVILQFLEHKEMRPNLVRVLSIILHFTPQETRRLVAKV